MSDYYISVTTWNGGKVWGAQARVSKHPDGRNWVLGKCKHACRSKAAAIAKAVHDAITQYESKHGDANA